VLLRLYVGVRSPRTNILVVGTGRLARELVIEILRRPELGIAVSGFADDNPALVGVSIVNPKVIGLCSELPRIVAENRVDRVVVELQDRRGRLPIEDLLALKTHGIGIEDATSLYERVTGKIAIENLKPSWMIFNAGFEVSRRMLTQKRIMSILVASAALLLLWPLIPIIMLLIKIDSKGPVFHRQERVGQNGHLFMLWKFRSMVRDAEKNTGAVWASQEDPRVTRVGRLLRRTRLDELPQIYNVLRGDMSLVGPRPERPHFVKELSALIPFYDLRHAVKPGMTGWAQIRYQYGNSVLDSVEKLQYDLFYIKHMSWLLDCLIVFDTVKTVLFRKGS
jgi:sugar transferase (PEP-CTERM system associated)